MLEENRNAVISGKWTEKSAGGCHLYHKAFEQKVDKFTWTTNPPTGTVCWLAMRTSG